MTQMMGLVDKDIKTVVITLFHVFWKLKERLSTVTRDMEDIFFKTPIKLLEIKTIISEIKNTHDRKRVNYTLQGKNIHELEDIQLKLSKIKHNKKKEMISRDLIYE